MLVFVESDQEPGSDDSRRLVALVDVVVPLLFFYFLLLIFFVAVVGLFLFTSRSGHTFCKADYPLSLFNTQNLGFQLPFNGLFLAALM